MDNKVSGKKLIIIVLILLAASVIGVVLVFNGIMFGKYMAYVSIPIGAIFVIAAAIGTFIGIVEKDF